MSSSLQKIFERAASENYWGDVDSVSGPGSNMADTRVIRREIPGLLRRYQIKSMLDAPCGDLFWMKEILPEIIEQGITYTGADIVPGLIEKHQHFFKDERMRFHVLDLTKDKVPAADLVLTRDCFIHLSYRNIYKILNNYKSSGITYLLTNTYTNDSRVNHDVDGVFLWGRMLNMQKFPFYFPRPLEIIVEECTQDNGEFMDKCLALWKIRDLNLGSLLINIGLCDLKRVSGKLDAKARAVYRKGKSGIKKFFPGTRPI